MTVFVVIWQSFHAKVLATFTSQQKATAYRDRFKGDIDAFMKKLGLPSGNERVDVYEVSVDPEYTEPHVRELINLA